LSNSHDEKQERERDRLNTEQRPTSVTHHDAQLRAVLLGLEDRRLPFPRQVFEVETWAPAWTIDQPAATLWYHPHLHPRTEDQVYRGITGMFLLDDPQAAALSLPDDYGVDDLPGFGSREHFCPLAWARGLSPRDHP
jgi:FtsP/CotA-like multicopper oxidase with cupredoxin domain